MQNSIKEVIFESVVHTAMTDSLFVAGISGRHKLTAYFLKFSIVKLCEVITNYWFFDTFYALHISFCSEYAVIMMSDFRSAPSVAEQPYDNSVVGLELSAAHIVFG